MKMKGRLFSVLSRTTQQLQTPFPKPLCNQPTLQTWVHLHRAVSGKLRKYPPERNCCPRLLQFG